MRRLLIWAGIIGYACLVAYAVTAMKKTVDEMTAEADHVVVGKVTAVEMLDRRGRPAEGGDTSLTEGNEIRLHVEPLRVLKGGEAIPSTIVVSLWRGWGHSLRDVKGDMQDKEFVFFLSGPEFAPLFLGEYYVAADQAPYVEQQLQ